MVTALITVAAIARLTQMAFGGWQIRRFNRASTACASRVGGGRPPAGRFQPRAIVAIAVDDDNRICDTLLMKGFTIFARPQKSPRWTANISRNCSLM